MSWPIPDIPSMPVVRKPCYGFWIFALFILLLGFFTSYFLLPEKIADANYFVYMFLAILSLWATVGGVVFYRYGYYLLSAKAWDKELQHTVSLWKKWSKWQQAVVANVVLSSEQDGITSLLGDIEKVPMFPEKARPLYGKKEGLSGRLRYLHYELDKQLPKYRDNLYQIYLLCSEQLYLKSVVSAVFEQWSLVPEVLTVSQAEDFFINGKEVSGLSLLLCVDCWPHGESGEHSEFITAQVLSTVDYVKDSNLSSFAALGRVMKLSAGELEQSLEMLFDYNELERADKRCIWLAGDEDVFFDELLMFSIKHDLELPANKSVRSLKLSFGPSSSLRFFVSLALMVDAAKYSNLDQLLISAESKDSGLLCYVKKGYLL